MSVPDLETSDAPSADGGSGAPERVGVDYRTLVEQIPAITYTEIHQEASQRTTYVSPQATRILGHRPEEFIANPELWRELRHPGDRAVVRAAERTAEVTRRPFHAEYRMYDRAGRLHWFRDDAVLVEDAGTGGTFWQGVMFEITAERDAEQQARDAELRYRTLVETLPCTVFVDELDERATNVYTSPQTQAMFGYSQQDWIDHPDLWLDRMVHPDDREHCRQAEARHVTTGESFDETYRIVHRDGRVLWVRDVAEIVRDEDGMPLYSQGFLLDITAHKAAESHLQDALERERAQASELRNLDELKNTLLHTLSHDLKGPITAVLAAASALKRPDLGEAERRELLDGMAGRAKRMDRLLSDMLDLERLGRGVAEPARFPVDIGQLVADLVHGTDVLESREVEMVARPVVAPVDPPKVERMIENLLVNAVRHTPRESRIWVRVLPHEGGALVVVEDDGPGVPEDLKANIFEAFRKGDPNGSGSGIGLSLVARFADIHGGRAWVQDRSGGGASFRVFLPGPQAIASGPGSVPTPS